ncbi:sialic acid-binding Ig-like lectin 10 [Takifugu flavidus]|uniref:Ig-like domain-containing protein n=2 Tax=Takifugu TaxID=31032 RepID=A0A4Z2CDV8_9TELE|nr:sialic acid-binding Ig-like lectin 10 [Takifugu flavidus]TNN02432.1 hypothetical protein fugu_009919 [Takifugu bimaculatus]
MFHIHPTMRLPGHVVLSLILLLASGSKGQSWDINVTSSIFAPPGSNVTIPCVFTYPRQFYTNDVQVYWKRGERSQFTVNDQDKNAFVYHTNDTWVLKRYRGKTKIIGNKDKGNCSLMIQDVDQNDTNLYLRVIAKGNQYSFYRDSVSITLLYGTHAPSNDSDTITESATLMTPLHMTIVVTLIALLILFIGAVLVIRQKWYVSIIRKDSGYSESFNRPTENHASSGKPPEEKFTEDPVYINMPFHSYQMQPRVDDAEALYANVEMLN